MEAGIAFLKNPCRSRPSLELRKEIDGESQLSAVQAMVAIDRDSSETQSLLPSLVNVLRFHTDDQYGYWAMHTLMKFGASAKSVVPLLRDALKSPRPLVRIRAVYVLEAIGPAAKDAIPDLTTLSRTEADENLQAMILTALASINKN